MSGWDGGSLGMCGELVMKENLGWTWWKMGQPNTSGTARLITQLWFEPGSSGEQKE